MLRQLKIPKKIDHETLLENGYLDEALERIEQKYNPHAIDYGNPYGNPMKIAFSRLPLEERYDMVFSPLLRWKRLGALEIFQEDIQLKIFARSSRGNIILLWGVLCYILCKVHFRCVFHR